jgi:RNA recognition motif-containing protein
MGGNVNMNQAIPMYQQLVPQRKFSRLVDRVQQLTKTAIRRTSSNSSLQTSTIRGPPRKPKQSGYALWVGNLPPGTHIIDLKDHFSRDATHDIESVFLISKSNCAFVNYKTESSCAAAMSRFHDSRFQGVRLVCRLRRGSAPSTGTVQPSSATAPAPAPSSSTTFPQTSSEGNLKSEGAAKSEEAEPAAQDLAKPEPGPQSTERVKEKFFVVKSLTIEDLERSVHTGVWATQAHNEDALNKAYQASSPAPFPFPHIRFC